MVRFITNPLKRILGADKEKESPKTAKPAQKDNRERTASREKPTPKGEPDSKKVESKTEGTDGSGERKRNQNRSRNQRRPQNKDEEGKGGDNKEGQRTDRPRRQRRRPAKRSEESGANKLSTEDAEAPQSKPKPVDNWKLEDFVVEPKEDASRFHDFDLPAEIMHAIQDLGFEYTTPIQAGTIVAALSGKDITGRAQTGTGKTAAFLLGLLTRLHRNPIPEGRKKRIASCANSGANT